MRFIWSAAVVGVVLVACGSRTQLLSSDPPGPPIFDAGVDAPDARIPACGDGILDPNEFCEDGNKVDTDACRANCTLAFCGDGVVHQGVELCDDGNKDDTDSCKSTCGPASCGDAIVQPPEQCDDANTDDGDACLSSCVLAFCGDARVRRGVEECDDGNSLDNDDCVQGCKRFRCGDGFTHASKEECDDGNSNDTDFCDNNCKKPVCGDGKKAGGEECDLGPNNGDRPAFLISQPGGTSIGTNPIVRNRNATQFYDYRSASSHTGFEAVGESRIYLYVDSNTGRLHLITTHGVDDDRGQIQPDARVDFDITGLPPGWAIDVVDDNSNEFFASGPSSVAGRWVFSQNSDGGVVGGLPFPGVWKITVTPRFQTGLTTWGWVRHDLQRIPLIMTEPITIEAFDQSSACRKNCTIPKCGDGILDGGEVCDDGNTVGGDGCSANCRSLQ